MSELLKWFEKRRESKVIATMRRHLATTMSAVEDLEKAVKASVNLNEKEAKAAIERVTSSEKEADGLVLGRLFHRMRMRPSFSSNPCALGDRT